MVLGNTKETEDCYNKILFLSQNLKFTWKKNGKSIYLATNLKIQAKKCIKKTEKYMIQNI